MDFVEFMGLNDHQALPFGPIRGGEGVYRYPQHYAEFMSLVRPPIGRTGNCR